MAVFCNLFNEIFKVLNNFSKLKDYFINYKKNNTYIFNSVFRVLSRSMSSNDLYKMLKSFSVLKNFSTHYTVFLMLAAQINSQEVEVKALLEFIKKRKRHIPINYSDLHYFKMLYENIRYINTTDDFFKLFQAKNSFENYKMRCLFFDIYQTLNAHDLNEIDPQKNQFYKFYQIQNITDVDAKFDLSATTTPHKFTDPFCYQDNEPRIDRVVQIPNEGIWTLQNVIVNSEFQILKNNTYILHDTSSDPRNGFVASHWQTTKYIKSTNFAMIYEHTIQLSNINSAALISGRCTKNYFHWLIEYAPKIIRFAESKLKIDYLLVGRDMPKQHYEFLDFLCHKYGLKYFKVEPNTHLKINTLYVPSQMTYIPDDPQYEYWESGSLYDQDLQHINNLATEMKNSASLPPLSDDFKRIYVTRKSARSRSITNETELELIFKSKGFKIVDTSQLNFTQQVQLFQFADVIASPAGAAMANLVFCKPEAKIICLVAELNKKFCIQANIAALRKCTFIYVTGNMTYPEDNYSDFSEYRFSDFTILPNKLEALLKDLDDNSLIIQ